MNQEEQNSRGLDSHLKTIKLYIYLNNKLILPVDIYPTDTLLDIRQFLSETSQLFFISSYHFEHKGTPLSEFIEISAQKDIENKARIDIKVDPYDEKSARYHLKKAQELIQNPFQYQNIFGSILRALKDPLLIAQELKDKEEKGETKLDDNALEFWEINQRKFGLNEIVQGKVSQFFEISSANRIGSSDINFIELLTFSAFNPPPTHRKLKGDFFYLHLKTLENNEFNITSCPRGFYINLSNQTTYNPTPLDNNVFYNLLDLICSVSPLCRKNLQKLIDEEVNEDNFYMKPLNLYTSETRWLCNQKENDLEIYKYDQIRTENFLIDFHGFDPSTVRDWNEELQMCKDLPKQDLIQRLNKDKVLLKIHSDFVEAATKGAKGIIDQYISPLNPQDDANKQVFVYNQIFFSIVTPTPDSYTQEKGLEASPTPTLANNDLRNLKILHRLDIPELYLLNTAIIDYKGQRILAQTIIPGILSCEHTQHADFGSVDDGKTIQCNAEFNELLKKVCDYFCLDNEVECLEENGNVVPLAGSPEIKGIRSANKKKFILDLARLSPRDANWIGTGDEYICCVIRPELISHFVVSKNFQFASDHIRQELIERKDREIEAQKETHDEKQLVPRSYEKSRSQNDKYLKDLQPKKNFTYLDYINKIQEYLTRNDGKEKYRFNANIYTRTKLKDLESNKHDAQKRDLDELSTFIIRQAMPTLIRDLLNGDIILPYDSKSLGELFHAHGINMRYIGRIYTSIQKEPFPFLHILLQRIMFAKSLKHFFREWLPKIESPYYGEAIAHIFNLVFSPNKVIEKLENKGTPHEDENTQKKLHNPDSEQKEPLNLFVPITLNLPESTFRKNLSKLLRYKPSDVWQRIREICRKRYLFDLPEQVKDFEPFKFPLTKIATLRDVCLSSGIVLECKDYMLMSTKLSKNDNLPFKPEDINDLIPIVKHLDPNCEDAKAQIELANCLTAEGKYEEALENLWGSMQIILNIYGPIHKDIAFCYSKLANIYYRLGEINQAIINHRQSVKILEKFYGFDNGQTGQGYFSLSFLYYHAKQYKKAFSCMFKSLYIFNIIGGEFHPECSLILSNMGLMYQDLDKPQAAINCFFESLERNILMYQSDGLKVANSYQSLALAHLDVHDYVKAIEYQRKCLEILKKNLHSDDARIKDAEVIFEKINKNVEERTLFYNFRFDELRKHQDRNKVKRSKEFEGDEEKDNQDDLDKAEDTIKQKEKEKLIQRLRSAKLNAKYGFRRPGNVDYLRLIQQQTQINGHSFDYPKHTESQSHDLLQGSFLG